MFLPFSITPEAAEFLRELMSKMPPEAEPSLFTVEKLGDSIDSRGEKTRWWYEGENFLIGCYEPSEKPRMMQSFDLLGRRVSIEPETLQRLTGRTLSLRPVAVRYGWFCKQERYVLVAASQDGAVNCRWRRRVGMCESIGTLIVTLNIGLILPVLYANGAACHVGWMVFGLLLGVGIYFLVSRAMFRWYEILKPQSFVAKQLFSFGFIVSPLLTFCLFLLILKTFVKH